MIISPERRYIFVHIPKTGGTALAQALESRAAREDILIGDTPKARKRKARAQALPARGRIWKHMRLADLDGALSGEEIADHFCFTMVRNPWDRVVSYYHWLKAQTFDHPAVALSRTLDFADFLAHPVQQTAFASDGAADYMRDAAGTDRGDLFIRLEHFEADAAPLWHHLGFSLILPKVNASRRERDYRSYYSADSAERVRALFQQDIERFGYAFDDGPAPLPA